MFPWFKKKEAAPIQEEKHKSSLATVTDLAYMMPSTMSTQEKAENTFAVAKPFPGVVPKKVKMASDAAVGEMYNYAAINTTFSEGIQFMGYPYLAELSQRPEYRRASETIAKEMTRKWITITYNSAGDKDDKITQIKQELERLNVQDLFRKASETDGFFGRAQLYIDVGLDLKGSNPKDVAELGMPLVLDKNKIGKGDFKRLLLIEPMWSYPNIYNAQDPLEPDFYKPSGWYVMGKEVHDSRLVTFVSREVPDILKPAYAFGGVSLSQMMKPYVDNWLRTRQSVSDLVQGFSVFGLKTNLAETLNMGGAQKLLSRINLFNQTRNNRGTYVIDKETEEFFNVSAPLSGLDQLQAQSQEHMSAVCGIPLVKLLGITPSGLNASSDGEMRCFYDFIEAQQEAVFRKPLLHILRLVQLSLFGEIDDNISFNFNPLWSLDEEHQAMVAQMMANTTSTYYQIGALKPIEIRRELARRADSSFNDLDLSDDALKPDPEGANVNVPVEQQPEQQQTSTRGRKPKSANPVPTTQAFTNKLAHVETPNVKGVKESNTNKL